MSTINHKQLDELRDLIGGDQDSLVELIKTFLEEGQEMILEMETSLESADLDTLRRCAHSMKSSSQEFGAIDLSELNATLESCLLYTSPSPRDLSTSRMPSSA